MNTQKKHDVFISYSRKDSAIAEKICKAFDQVDVTYFIDREKIGGTANYFLKIADGIDNSKIMLLLASANSYKSKYVSKELQYAFEQEIVVLPYSLDDTLPPKDFKMLLISANWHNFNNDPIVPKLLTSIAELLGKEEELVSKIEELTKKIKDLELQDNNASKKSETTQSTTLEEIATQELLLNDHVRESLPETTVREIVKLVLSADGISTEIQESFIRDLKYGLATAQNNLGYMLKDPEKKIKWFEKAAKNGSGAAMLTLGKLYAYGEGVEKNPNKALDYFRAASSNGYHEEAVSYVKELLEEIGDCNAPKQVNIPTEFEKILTNKPYDRIKRLEESAMMGNVGAMIELANMYDLGIDVERNIDQAIYYYGQAVVKGGHTEYVDEINRLKQEKRKIEEDTNAIVNILDSSNKRRQFIVNNIPLGMIQVEGGKFKMGAISRQRVDAFNRELPVREVTLSTYYIAETPITQELWQAVMGNNPSYFNSDMKNPVEQVSWEDCQIFIQKLNQLTGKNFRLPTEAEWEFAARGGINSLGYKYSGSNQIKEVAWQQVPNEEGKTYPVALKRPNELGVYDMSGNVWEWCNDWYGAYTNDELVNPQGAQTGDVRVCRGGCWHSHERYCCVFFRSFRAQHEKTNYIGLRLVMTE